MINVSVSVFRQIALFMAMMPVNLLIGPKSFANECRDSFRTFLHAENIDIGTLATLRGFENEKTRLLGHGEFGGHVYLVTPTEITDAREPFVVKVFDQGGRFVAQNDEIAYAILSQALNADHKAGSLRSVDKIERLDELTLKLRYVAGRDVEQVSWSAGPYGARLNRLFLRQLQEAKRKLDRAGTFTVGGAAFKIETSRLYPTGFEGKAKLEINLKNLDPGAKPANVKIILKSDGVLLSQGGQFVVIDPS